MASMALGLQTSGETALEFCNMYYIAVLRTANMYYIAVLRTTEVNMVNGIVPHAVRPRRRLCD